MHLKSVKTTVSAAVLLIFCFTNESMAGRRDGTIGSFCKVDPDASMDPKSVLGSHCVMMAEAHLFRGAIVREHSIIDEGAKLYKRATVMTHVHIGSWAEIGNGTTCESHTSVGRKAIVNDKAVLKEHSMVMSRANVGRRSVIGEHVIFGRRAVSKEYSYVAEHAQIGSGAILGPYSIVNEFVVVPSSMKVDAKQIVISAPETTILLRILRKQKFSQRFRKEVEDLIAKSDRRFVRYFSKELTIMLESLNSDCGATRTFASLKRQLMLLIYSYLVKMHGETKFQRALISTKGQMMINGKPRAELDDCQDVQRYDKIFEGTTVRNFMLALTIYYDSQRKDRVIGEKFCEIVEGILSNDRSVLAINHVCGGKTSVKCDDCVVKPQP